MDTRPPGQTCILCLGKVVSLLFSRGKGDNFPSIRDRVLKVCLDAGAST